MLLPITVNKEFCTVEVPESMYKQAEVIVRLVLPGKMSYTGVSGNKEKKMFWVKLIRHLVVDVNLKQAAAIVLKMWNDLEIYKDVYYSKEYDNVYYKHVYMGGREEFFMYGEEGKIEVDTIPDGVEPFRSVESLMKD